MSSVKALLFDVFGTVVDWRSCISAEFEQYARKHNLDCVYGHIVQIQQRCKTANQRQFQKHQITTPLQMTLSHPNCTKQSGSLFIALSSDLITQF